MWQRLAPAGVHVSGQGDGPLKVWRIDRLWVAARSLPVEHVLVEEIRDFDRNIWFGPGGEVPTCRVIASHARRILDADLEKAIILSAEGHVMDGMHRVAKAWLLGREKIKTVRFPKNPPPDTTISPKMSHTDAE